LFTKRTSRPEILSMEMYTRQTFSTRFWRFV
jgi:hypothetical protein